jgi:hypothetical protein
MSSANATNFNLKDCVYGCNTRIYWNASTSEYWEELAKRKHICPNRSNSRNKPPSTSINSDISAPKPTSYNNNNYRSSYSKKQWTPKLNNKQPVDNSLEILQGTSPDTIRKQYEVLTDLIKEYNGKIHGSQSHILASNSIQLIVYYEVPEGMREEIKRTFESFTRNELKVYHHQQP